MTDVYEQQIERATQARRTMELEISPTRVAVDVEGFCTRSLVVRLPKDFTADELKVPEHWRAVQVSVRALRRFDRLMLISYDESWLAEAMVSDADHTKVILTKPRITEFSTRYDGNFEDDVYRVRWNGAGFHVERKADGHVMTGTVATAGLAERDLRGLYPRVA